MIIKVKTLVVSSILVVSLGIGTSFYLVQNTSQGQEQIGSNIGESLEVSLDKEKKGSIDALIRVESFVDTVEESDLVAKVEIVEVVKEINDEPSPKTVFKANVLEVFKNGKLEENNLGSIQILQHGNSEWSFNDNPLFQGGQQYIFMLKEADGFENTYWLLGEEANFYQIVEDNLIVSPKFKRNELDDISSVDTGIIKDKKGAQFFNKDRFENKLKVTIGEKEKN